MFSCRETPQPGASPFVVGKHGGPLLNHGRHAFFLIVGVEQKGELGGFRGLAGGHRLDGGLVDGGLGGGQGAAGLAHQLSGHLHRLGVDGVVLGLGRGGLRRLGGGLGGVDLLLHPVHLGGLHRLLGLPGGGVQAGVAGGQPVQQSQLIGLLTGDHLGQHHQLLGLGGPHNGGGPGAAVGAGDDAQPHFGEGQGGAGAAHPEVAGQGHLAAAAERKAADGRDGGDGHGLQNVVDFNGQAAEFPGVPGGGLRHLLHVGAGGKGPLRAGHDEHPDGGVGLHQLQGGHDVLVDLAVQGVQSLGPVELDGGDTVLHLVDDVGKFHGYRRLLIPPEWTGRRRTADRYRSCS